jgi:pimeloyl-ACP methyl ester carboxylesterase
MGDGEPVFLLLHGLGPGLFTWQALMPSLSEYGRVIAIDRPAAGLSERPLGDALKQYNPYTVDAQVQLFLALLDQLGLQQVFLVGNSAGGTLAVHTYLQAPGRSQGLVLVDAAIFSGGGAPSFVKPLLGTQQLRRIGPFFARSLFENPENFLKSAYFDHEKITEETIAGYRRISMIEDWDLAFWELSIAGENLRLSDRLDEINLPVLVVSGEYDSIVPPQDSQRLAEEIPGAEFLMLPNCGHLPQEECPDVLLDGIVDFASELQE